MKKNTKPKKQKTVSFAFEDGYEALEWLENQAANTRLGISGYIINLLLEDKKQKTKEK